MFLFIWSFERLTSLWIFMSVCWLIGHGCLSVYDDFLKRPRIYTSTLLDNLFWYRHSFWNFQNLKSTFEALPRFDLSFSLSFLSPSLYILYIYIYICFFLGIWDLFEAELMEDMTRNYPDGLFLGKYIYIYWNGSETPCIHNTHLNFRPTSYVSFVPIPVASNWSSLWSCDHMITNKLRGIHRILPTFGEWNPKDKLLFYLKTKI